MQLTKINEPAGTQNTGGLCHAENNHAPALTDRPYRVQIHALRPVFRESLGFIHGEHKTGSEAKRAGLLPPFSLLQQDAKCPRLDVIH